MWSFLSQFVNPSRAPLTVVVVDPAHTGAPVQHAVEPRRILIAVAMLVAGTIGLTVLLLTLTPLRGLVSGAATPESAEGARAQAARLAGLEDSLQLQREYIERFRRLMTNEAGAAGTSNLAPRPVAPAPSYEPPPRPASSQGRSVPPGGAAAVAAVWTGEPTTRLLPGDAGGLPLPAPAPVQGFVTRGFDARTGHFGVDIATGTGSVVRTVGDGFVIFADWTYEGGHTLVVQHADGYVSVYKHNEQLLRRAGERVRARDAVAVSGNSGEITTGPHLHFELWRDGLPQDPRAFVVGW